MQLMVFNYNILAFFEMKLQFHCNAAWIMSIIKNDYSLPPMCNHKATPDFCRAGFVF